MLRGLHAVILRIN